MFVFSFFNLQLTKHRCLKKQEAGDEALQFSHLEKSNYK